MLPLCDKVKSILKRHKVYNCLVSKCPCGTLDTPSPGSFALRRHESNSVSC